MRTTSRWYWVVTGVIVVGVILLGACGSGEQPPEPELADGAALLEARCTSCHGLSKTTNEQKTPEQWQQTVTRMVNKGAQLSADEQATLVTYLAETYAP